MATLRINAVRPNTSVDLAGHWTRGEVKGLLRSILPRNAGYAAAFRGFLRKRCFIPMILGLILLVIGGLLLAKNRNLAMMWGGEYHAHQVAFSNSIARQNIAVVGGVLLAGGLALIVLF